MSVFDTKTAQLSCSKARKKKFKVSPCAWDDIWQLQLGQKMTPLKTLREIIYGKVNNLIKLAWITTYLNAAVPPERIIQPLFFLFFLSFFKDESRNLPKIVSVRLPELVGRFFVSCMLDFFWKPPTYTRKYNIEQIFLFFPNNAFLS